MDGSSTYVPRGVSTPACSKIGATSGGRLLRSGAAPTGVGAAASACATTSALLAPLPRCVANSCVDNVCRRPFRMVSCSATDPFKALRRRDCSAICCSSVPFRPALPPSVAAVWACARQLNKTRTEPSAPWQPRNCCCFIRLVLSYKRWLMTPFRGDEKVGAYLLLMH